MSENSFRLAFPTESQYVERKTGVGSTPIQETAVAFSNAGGGVTLIGVDDHGGLVGRELTPGLEDDLHQIMRQIHDPGRYELATLQVGRVAISVLSVAERVGGVAQTSSGRVLVRKGTRNEPVFGAELRDLLNRRTLQRFEETDADSEIELADASLLARLADAYGWSGAQTYASRLEEHGLTVRGQPVRLTIAGALCLLERPHDRLGKTFIEVLRFPQDGGDYDRRTEITGPAYEQVERATSFVMDELGTDLVVLGVRRHELPRVPRVVLREAVANAVAHRSYEASGSSIRIELRLDSITVISPGGLPEPVTVQNIRETQAARNLRVITVLRRFGLAEYAGRGVDVMESSMREELLEPPVFEDTGYSVRVTLSIRSAVAPSERAWVREVESRGLIEPSDRILLIHAARGDRLTNARTRELVGGDSRDAREALHRLRDAGFLEQRGERGGATYELQESLAPPAGLRLDARQLDDLVMTLAREEPLTNARIRARTGLERAEALRVLDRLVEQGRLRRVGAKRGTRYLLA